MPEVMPLNPEAQNEPPDFSMAMADEGEPSQITQINSANNSLRPPLDYNIILPLYQPTAAGVNDRGVLPSYEEAINPNAPPPSYESLFGRIKGARKGFLYFLQSLLQLLLGTIGCTIILGIVLIIPVCMIVIGGVYLYDCPQAEYIPIYLLVGGIFSIIKQLVDWSNKAKQGCQGQEEVRIRQTPTQTLLNGFMVGWIIMGSIWVYREYEPNYDPSRGKYCNKTLYLFAFWQITLVYIFIAFFYSYTISITFFASV